MKNLLTALFITAVFSLNIFAQYNFSLIGSEQKTDASPDKMISAEIMEGDDVSHKINPVLDLMINRISEGENQNNFSASSLSDLREFIYFYTAENEEYMMPLLIRTSSVESTVNNVTTSNGFIGTIAGDILTVHLPVSAVRSLAMSPEVIYIDASTISDPKLDLSRIETKVKQLHDGTGISRPYKGNGVVVGVVDSGIDWKHQDFKNAGGSRIKFLWDMSGTGNPPSGYSYGTEYTKAQIDANQCFEIDGDDGGGHGTHVAGTAAGNGGASPTYLGMAPESDIVFVKGFRTGPGFADSDVLDGCNYIFQKAQQLGKPAAINLSLGGHFGAHDGTSNYEQALSNLTGNGKIIIAAAGNEGGQPIHLSYSVTGTSFNDGYETFLELYENGSVIGSDMWYNGGNINVGLAAYDPQTGNLIGYSPAVSPGQVVQDMAFTVQGITYGFFTIDATGVNNPNNGANRVYFELYGNSQVNIGNVWWSLYTYGTGTFDAWALGHGVFSTFSGQPWIKPGDNQRTIGMPGTAQKLICVGSYVTKNQWTDINGTIQYQPGNPVIGSISGFSSIGPSRDGRMKPDIVAPGEVIVAAYSSFLTQTPPANIVLGGQHQKMQGTSMASPHVTGTVALLLEKNSSLNYDQAVTILKNTTKKDNFTGPTANNIYGHGKLDAYNAFLNTSGGGGGQVTLLEEGFDSNFPPTGWVHQVSNSSYTWQRGNPQGNNFNQIDPQSLYSALCPWVAQNQNEWLISPAFNLGNGNASVEFYAGYSTQWLTGATLKLHISTNGGSNWNQLWTADNDGQGWLWRNKTIDLSAYSNTQNLKLGWQYVGNDGDLVSLDGIKLLGYASDADDQDPERIYTYDLRQNYPNPFNPSTIISYQLPEPGKIKLKVFDILGSEVATLVDEYKNAGRYDIEFNGFGLASGIYFYHLISGDYSSTKKMILIK